MLFWLMLLTTSVSTLDDLPTAAAVPAAAGRTLDYDAVEPSTKRKARVIRTGTEDEVLDDPYREQLNSQLRDVRRNFAIAAWMIRKHLDFCTSFNFHGKCRKKDLNKRLEEYVQVWGKKQNFHAARRHNRRRFLRICEAGRTVEGDFEVHLLSSGRVGGIEGDRIRTPYRISTDAGEVPEDLVHGVQLDAAGGAVAFALHDRDRNLGGFKFRRMVPARYIIQHGFFDREDQVRGISPLAPGYNSLCDIYEGIGLQLAKQKVESLFAFIIKANDERPAGRKAVYDEDENEDDDEAVDKYEVDPGKGPLSLEVDTDEDASFLNAQGISAGSTQFLKDCILITLKCLDLPYSLFDEQATHYSGQRTQLLVYEESARDKRGDNQELLDTLTDWRVRLGILDGDFELKKSERYEDLRWEWRPRRIPWGDPIKEITAFGHQLDRWVTSRSRWVREHDDVDFDDLLEERLAEEKKIRQALEKLGPMPFDPKVDKGKPAKRA